MHLNPSLHTPAQYASLQRFLSESQLPPNKVPKATSSTLWPLAQIMLKDSEGNEQTRQLQDDYYTYEYANNNYRAIDINGIESVYNLATSDWEITGNRYYWEVKGVAILLSPDFKPYHWDIQSILPKEIEVTLAGESKTLVKHENVRLLNNLNCRQFEYKSACGITLVLIQQMQGTYLTLLKKQEHAPGDVTSSVRGFTCFTTSPTRHLPNNETVWVEESEEEIRKSISVPTQPLQKDLKENGISRSATPAPASSPKVITEIHTPSQASPTLESHSSSHHKPSSAIATAIVTLASLALLLTGGAFFYEWLSLNVALIVISSTAAASLLALTVQAIFFSHVMKKSH